MPAQTSQAQRLLPIREVAAGTGLTARAIRHYESLGLLCPRDRSEGDHRRYDASDVERLRLIREFRDDAGFSLAEIALILEDEAARERNRAAYRATEDLAVQRDLVVDSMTRLRRQADLVRSKIARLQEVVATAEERQALLRVRLGELDEQAAVGAVR